MADSTGAEQDGAITSDRFNGLMSAYQKSQTEVATLKAQLAGSGSQDPPKPAEGSRSEFEEGALYEYSEGRLQPYESPTPRGTNGGRREFGPARDDGSPEAALAKVRQALGGSADKTSWP